MKCKHCNGPCIKKGFQGNKQRYRCKSCSKYQLEEYTYKAYNKWVKEILINMVKEGNGPTGVARTLKISRNTVTTHVLKTARKVTLPLIPLGKTYEVDELCTYIGRKNNRYWVVCAYCKETRQVLRYALGKRNKSVLGFIINTLCLAQAKQIHTDKLNLYKFLIPPEIHNTKARGTNHVERVHLNLRTHIRPLMRRTLCFSKSTIALNALLTVYFFG